MSDWYFENKGERGGPVSADELKGMLASGAIGLASLVWTAAFGREWKRVADTELAPPEPVLPPPLPGSEPPALPKASHSADRASIEDFLASDLTRALLGKKENYYLAKWRPILAKAGTDPKKLAMTRSWNWPALFLPYGWLLYRKLYALGGILLALQLAYVLLPDSVPTSIARAFLFATFVMAVIPALYGNAWYLDVVYRRWELLRQEPDQKAALAKAGQGGGVNLVAPIAAFALIITVAILSYLNPIGWGDPMALVRNGHMTAYPSTTVGKAFAGNFDDGQWRSFTTPKGQQVIEFTGKINTALHGNAARRVYEAGDDLRKSASSPAHAEQLNFNYRLTLFQLAYGFLKDKPELERLKRKWECPVIEQTNLAGGWVGMMPRCDQHASELMGDAIDSWVADGHWPVGMPVTVQWTVQVDGKSFDLTNLASKAWNGLKQDHVLDTLFE